MDFIRHLLGLDKVTYMGYSYGTWLGAWYGSLFSDNIERMALDSATDSTQESIQTLYNAAHEGRDRQFRLRMMNWISRNDEVFGLGTDPETIWKRYFAATSTPEKSLATQWSWNAVNGPAAFSNPIGYRAAGSLVAGIIAEGEAPSKPVVPAESAARVVDQTELTDEQRAAAHYGTEEVDRPVIDFLLGGDRPAQTIVAAGKPLPLERSTYESWTPLDENAEHATEAPLFTDPTIPAETGVVREPRN
ncbi:alpha/beta fold hydrolase [Streptomyces scopuliridis]